MSDLNEILGGIVGGWVFGTLGIWPGGGMIGSIGGICGRGALGLDYALAKESVIQIS
jgi:hypothetical protein